MIWIKAREFSQGPTLDEVRWGDGLLQFPISFLNVEEVWVTSWVTREVPRSSLGLFQFGRREAI